MRLYSVVALIAFGVITLVSVFSLSIGKYKWVYLVYTFLSLVYFCISRCQLRSFLGKKLVVYSFFAAPLLFTALSNQFWSTDMMQPIANLPVTIFKFAMSPFAEWQQLAWAGVLIITLCVLLLNILARVVFAKNKHG